MKTIPLTFDETDYFRLKGFRSGFSDAKSWEKFVIEMMELIKKHGSNIRQRTKR